MLNQRQSLFLFLAWIIAFIGTVSALYGSEVMNLNVCNLCWYQRIVMFPLVWILGVGILRKDKMVNWYAVPLAIFGLVFALYQVLEQHFPKVASIYSCTKTVPCTEVQFKLFGFFTFPMMSMMAFAAILICLVLFRFYTQKDKPHI